MSGRKPRDATRKRRKSGDEGLTPDPSGPKPKRQTSLLRSFSLINRAVAHAEAGQRAGRPAPPSSITAAPGACAAPTVTIDLTGAAAGAAGIRRDFQVRTSEGHPVSQVVPSGGPPAPSASQTSRGSQHGGRAASGATHVSQSYVEFGGTQAPKPSRSVSHVSDSYRPAQSAVASVACSRVTQPASEEATSPTLSDEQVQVLHADAHDDERIRMHAFKHACMHACKQAGRRAALALLQEWCMVTLTQQFACMHAHAWLWCTVSWWKWDIEMLKHAVALSVLYRHG
eukprot:284920-Chlamydomonas_euryale.AAC.9